MNTLLFSTALLTAAGGSSLLASEVRGNYLVADVVEWRAEDGGNGHAYAIAWHGEIQRIASRSGPRDTFVAEPLVWSGAEIAASQLGGHLATITSSAENDFVTNLIATTPRPSLLFVTPERANGWWLGGYQSPGSSNPAANWNWVTGEPFQYTNWIRGEPNDFAGIDEVFLHYWWSPDGLGWNDEDPNNLRGFSSFIVEIPVPEPTAAWLAALACGLISTRPHKQPPRAS